jgi:HK97 family phage major capsid protein
MDIRKLKAARSARYHAIEVLAKKLDRANVEDANDLLLFESLKGDLATLDAQIRSANAERARTAVPVYDPTSVSSPTLRRNLTVRSFKDEATAYRAGRFLWSVLGHEPSRQWLRNSGIAIKAQTEGTGAAGAVLVPEEWLQTIINLKEQFGVAARYCQKIPMQRDSVQWPRRTGGATASFVGEGVAPAESTTTFDNINLVAKKMAALVRVSTELVEDSLVSVADYLTSEIAYSFASKEDDCLFLGDGTSTYGGIQGLKALFAANTAGVFTATGHTTFDTVTATDIAGLMGLLPAFALPNAKFYCSQSFYRYAFTRLGVAGAGNTIQTLGGAMPYSWLGKEIVISQKLPAQTASNSGVIVAYYGDLAKAAAFGERRTVTIKRSNERYFDSDQVGLMGTERIDIVVHDVGTTSVIGPLVALKMG